MTRRSLFTCTVLPPLTCGGALWAQEYPSATITNGIVTVKLYLPDPQHGSYRGTRFDWSGIIQSLT